MNQFKFLFFTFFGIFIAFYFLYVGYFYFNQSQLVFRASKLPTDYEFRFDSPFEEKSIKSNDGTLLHGILFKNPNPKGLVFYLHGNAGNLDTWGRISEIYTHLDYDIFILDYRGFGKSQGVIENEEQVLKDVQIAFDSVSKNYNKKIIVGYSIGTGPASYLASIRKNELLILKAPYDNFKTYSDIRAPYFPDFLKKFKFESNKYLALTHSPVYIFHGNNDQLIGIENSYRLKKLLKKTDSLFVLNNQGHVGINDNPEYKNKLKSILK
jgi:uncharacterized protein